MGQRPSEGHRPERRGPARLRPDRPLGADRPGRAHRPRRGRLGGQPLGDDPALAQPGAVLDGRRSTTRSSAGTSASILFQLPFVRWSSRAPTACCSRPWRSARALPARRPARRAHVHDPDAGPPRRPRRVVPRLDRDRLPARQARARVQHERRRRRRQLHRPERPVLRLRRADVRCRRLPARSSSAGRSPACSGRSAPWSSSGSAPRSSSARSIRPSIQRLSVEPDQLGKETTYIQNNIAMTRISRIGLDSWTLTHVLGPGSADPGGGDQ